MSSDGSNVSCASHRVVSQNKANLECSAHIQADYALGRGKKCWLSGISFLAEYSLILVGYDHSGLAILILIALKAKRTRH